MDVIRRVAGDGVELFVDANGAYQPKQAIRVGVSWSERGVTWFEEPVSSDDLPGLRTVRLGCDIDVAAGGVRILTGLLRHHDHGAKPSTACSPT